MAPRRAFVPGFGLWLGWVLAVVGMGCAQVGRPPGGPVDDTPPALLSAKPGSLAVDVARDAPLRFSFSEKIERRGAARALRLVPDVALERPRFEDLDVEFRPLEGWPADTVVVWTLEASLADKHRVKMDTERKGAFTTGPAFPPGSIVGSAAVRDTAGVKWSSLRATLNLPPPPGSRRPVLWRQANTLIDGSFTLPWLRPGSGPFELEVFLDANANGRADEKERQASRDSLRLAEADTVLDVGTLLLLDRESPVDLVFCAPTPDSSAVVVWAAPRDDPQEAQSATADSTGCAVLSLTPGEYTWGAWIERDPDGKWGVDSLGIRELSLAADSLTVLPELPDSLLAQSGFDRSADASADSARVPEALWKPADP